MPKFRKILWIWADERLGRLRLVTETLVNHTNKIDEPQSKQELWVQLSLFPHLQFTALNQWRWHWRLCFVVLLFVWWDDRQNSFQCFISNRKIAAIFCCNPIQMARYKYDSNRTVSRRQIDLPLSRMVRHHEWTRGNYQSPRFYFSSSVIVMLLNSYWSILWRLSKCIGYLSCTWGWFVRLSGLKVRVPG
jgi:hypothetical protein